MLGSDGSDAVRPRDGRGVYPRRMNRRSWPRVAKNVTPRRSLCLGALALALGCEPATSGEAAPPTPTPASSGGATGEEPTTEAGGGDTGASEPLPESLPQPPPEAAPEPTPKRPSYGHADLDPDNDDIVGPQPEIEGCHERLEELGIAFKPARIGVGHKRDGVYTCGAHQVVRIKRGPGKIKYSSWPMLTCQMAIAWSDFERIVQEEAERELGSRVVKIEHMGTYNCRDMALYDLISEHSFANGIDLKRFHLANGKQVDVKKHFQPRELEPPTPESRFLRSLSRRLYDEDVFSNVITPYFDRVHHNHIHVDLARYRVDGTRP